MSEITALTNRFQQVNWNNEGGRSVFLAVAWMVGILGSVPLARATSIAPGDDIWVTPCGGGTYVDVSIPAGFFGPGSDMFTGHIILGGSPIGIGGSGLEVCSGACPLTAVNCVSTGMPSPPFGEVDTIVKRKAAAVLSCGDVTGVTIPIELVALNLVSCSPITVTYGGGATSESWVVAGTCLDGLQADGMMTIKHECFDGGSFSSSLPVDVMMTFVCTTPPCPVPSVTLAQTVTMVSCGQWSHCNVSAPPSLFRLAPGGTFTNYYCLGGPALITTNTAAPDAYFFTGVDVLSCDPGECGSQHQVRKRELTSEEAMLAAHGILPVNQERASGQNGGTVVTQACSLAGPGCNCQDLPPSQCITDGGTPGGPGTNCANLSSIPTLSEWGMIVLALVFVAVAGLIVKRQRKPAPA